MSRTAHEFLFEWGRTICWDSGRVRITVIAICSSLTAFAAPGSADSILPYGVRLWQADDGLPHNSVYAIVQSREGYLWVGTREGLARFDGVRFTPLGEEAPAALRQDWITALCTGRDGSLWIGCDGYGLARVKEGKFSRLSEADGLLSNQIRCLLEGSDGALWIGSEGGLTRYQDGRFRNFTEKNGLASNSVRGLCEDPEGNLRVATGLGLSTLDKEGNIHNLKIGQGAVANSLKFVCTDRRGRIWTGSNQGLTCVDRDKVVTYGVGQGLPEKIVTVGLEDHAGQLWVGTYRGVARLIEAKVVPPPNREGAWGDLIYTLCEDREGSIWVGAQDGLYRLTPARFTAYTTEEGLSRNNAMSVCEDRSGTIWIGIWSGGLNELKDGRITARGVASRRPDDKVLALHEGRDGSLWIGLDHGGGLNCYKDGAMQLVSRQPGVLDAPIRVIHEDRQGILWVGTSRGLNAVRGSNIQTYTKADGLAGNTVLALLEDGAGRLWIGSDGGLDLFEGGRLTAFPAREALSQHPVNALYEDHDGTLWIGTKGGGLVRYRDGKFTACTTRQGLFSDEVYEILEDDFGFFWMSCRKGIFRVRKKELEDLHRGAIPVVSCTAFGRADGLPSIQCNGVAKPAGWKGRDGRLWFPTIRGVVAVEPRIKTNRRPPPVLIEEVKADGQPLREGALAASELSSLTVPPGRGSVEIRYTALSLQAPEKNRFKYRLEGLEREWNDVGAQRSASYNNVAPGRYRFRVIACNDDGVWNETGATLSLIMAPHYWQTWWFKLAVGGATALLLALLYRLRVQRLRALERLRVQIAANLHDDVGARLTKVAMVTEMVDRETADQHPSKLHVRNIVQTVREITQAMDEIVWTINPKNDTLDHLASYIFQYAQEYFQDTGVNCRLDVPAQLPDRPVSTETRHNVFMAVKEALNNTLKHAQATEVHVGLALLDGRLAVTISDNGRGFSLGEARAKGEGLENMKQRLARIGGQLVLESQPSQGTRVRMEAGVA